MGGGGGEADKIVEICILLAQIQFCLSGDMFRSCLCFVWCFSAVTAGGGLVAILKYNIIVHYKQYNSVLDSSTS